jgi:putative endonuclease
MLLCVSSAKKRTYIGYTNNIKKRLKNHNSNKGAKYTKGNRWKVIYKKNFLSKTKAMSYEYILKHDRKKRLKIYNSYK